MSFKTLFSRLFSKVTKAETEVTSHPSETNTKEPVFLLEQTLKEWRAERDRLLIEVDAEMNVVQRQRKTAEAVTPRDATSPADAELARREALAQTIRLNERANVDFWAVEEKKRHLECGLEHEFRKLEKNNIALSGQIILERVIQEPSIDTSRSESMGGPSEKWDRVERRLVRFSGRVFVCQVRHRADQRNLGECRDYRVMQGSVSHWYEPTGTYQPPVSDWVTDSLEQMTNEELIVIR